MACNPGVPFRIMYKEGAKPIDESKPSIIIANHSSVLDLLGIMVLHTKVAIITKDWVAHNILFGDIARAFDIIPASCGIEDMLPAVRERVEQGFSIVILPEGTRSLTGELQRLHRGAFYLAEQLTLPIQPVLIRGTFQTLSKVRVKIGKPASMDFIVLPQITPVDKRFGDGFRERTRNVAHYYYEHLDMFAYPYSSKD